MLSFDEAQAIIAGLPDRMPVEAVTLDAAYNRVLAEAIRARIDAPRADTSGMDGYAVRDADLAQLPAMLRVVGEAYPGRPSAVVSGEGQCVRIFTGAPVPAGADRVVIQENVTRDGDFARIDRPQGQSSYIRPLGSDFRAGEKLLEHGTRLDARALVTAAAADVGELSVYCRPRIAVLSTGDELVEPGTAADRPHAIPQSISHGVAALAQEWGGRWLHSQSLKDDLPSLEEAAKAALLDADLVIVTGGASVGEKDFAKAMFASSGLDLLFDKVAIKPGKPVWLARAQGKLVLGLPGNPTSAMVTARLFLAPLLLRLTGAEPPLALRWESARTLGTVPANGDRESFLRGRRERGGIALFSNQDSGAQSTLAMADALVRIAPHATAQAIGTVVETLAF